MRTLYKSLWLSVCMVVMCAGAAHAFQFQASDSIKGSLDMQLTLGAGMRMEKQNPNLIGDTRMNPDANTFQSSNGDDGDLNYNQYDLFTTYLKFTPELLLKFPADFKFMARGTALYDFKATDTRRTDLENDAEKTDRAGRAAAGSLGEQGLEHRLPAHPDPGGEPGHQLGGEPLRDRRDRLRHGAGLPEVLDSGNADQGSGPSRPDDQRGQRAGTRRQRGGVLPVPLVQEQGPAGGHLFLRGGYLREGNGSGHAGFQPVQLRRIRRRADLRQARPGDPPPDAAEPRQRRVFRRRRLQQRRGSFRRRARPRRTRGSTASRCITSRRERPWTWGSTS